MTGSGATWPRPGSPSWTMYITNQEDFDSAERGVQREVELRDRAKTLYEAACSKAGQTLEELAGPATWLPADDREGLIEQGLEVGITKRLEALGPDITGLQELLTYGLKGMAAYAYHARRLGREDAGIYAFLWEALDLLANEAPSIDRLFAMCLRCGEVNRKVLELLDAAHTSTYGHPTPTPVRISPSKGKAILVSGHDLKSLEELLKQTEGQRINIYTHGEMLPAHGYPGLRRFSHLVGNYGGAWQAQQREFAEFPGPILMTTNCLMEPQEAYRDRLFTSNVVGWPGIKHLDDRDFTPLIEAALAAPGFEQDGPDKKITVGFGHAAVMNMAERIVSAVKSGRVRHIFLIGGCDGAKPGRNYYTELARAVPSDCIILTLACGKYRFNKFDFGKIAGLPRLLDLGQCNDAYSAIRIALALAEALGTEVNELPLSLVLSWYEQKAVSILLTLLHLGIKGIRLGPSLPAFLTPATLEVLVKDFNIMPISTVKEDLRAILKPPFTRSAPSP